MKRLILAGFVTLGALVGAAIPPAQADPPTSCAAVTCLPCPEGFRQLLQPPQCCRCVPDN